jgi:hypothetical protein
MNLLANIRAIVLGRNSPKSRTTIVMINVLASKNHRPVPIIGARKGSIAVVIKDVNITKAILFPTNIVPRKFL